MLAAKLGAQDGIGDIDINISFSSDNNHILKNGVKIAADLIVDPDNSTLVDKLGQGVNPFVELTINSLHVKDANNKNIAPTVNEYKDNLQLQVKEHIAIDGIAIMNPVRHIELGLYATLDLLNETDNKTELRFYCDTFNDPEYTASAQEHQTSFELIYKEGHLSLATNSGALLAGAATLTYAPYELVLAAPVGRLVDGILPAEQKTAFDALYWEVLPTTDPETGKLTGGTWNKTFKGMMIDNVNFADILGLLMPAGDDEQASAGSAAEGSSINIFNVIGYAFSLFTDVEDGKFSLGATDLVATICDFAKLVAGMDLTKEGLADMVNGLLTSKGLDIVKQALSFNGMVTTEDAEKIGELLDSIELNADFDLTQGLDWELGLIVTPNTDGYFTFYDKSVGNATVKSFSVDSVTAPKEVSISYTGGSAMFSAKTQYFKGEEIVREEKIDGWVVNIEGKMKVGFKFVQDPDTQAWKVTFYKQSELSKETPNPEATIAELRDTIPGARIVWTSSIRFGEAVEINESALANDYLTKKAQLAQAQADVTSATEAYNDAEDTYEATQLYDAYQTANRAYNDAYSAYSTKNNAVKKLAGYGATSSKGTPGYLFNEYDKAYQAWIKAGKPAEETAPTKKALTDAETAIGTGLTAYKEAIAKFKSGTEGDLFTKYVTDYKAYLKNGSQGTAPALTDLNALFKSWYTGNSKYYALVGNNIIKDYLNAEIAWENDGSKTEGELYDKYVAAKKAYDDALKAAREEVNFSETDYQAYLDAWNGKDQEQGLKALLEAYRDASSEQSAALKAAQAQKEYNDMKTAESTKTQKEEAHKAITDVTNVWFYWDIKAEA